VEGRDSIAGRRNRIGVSLLEICFRKVSSYTYKYLKYRDKISWLNTAKYDFLAIITQPQQGTQDEHLSSEYNASVGMLMSVTPILIIAPCAFADCATGNEIKNALGERYDIWPESICEIAEEIKQ
jgi:hypothetical protein